MAETRLCPECGAELPSEAPEGLCPKCLLAAGLDDSVTDQVPAADAATIAPSESNSPGSPPGTKVHYFGDYEILEEIARGGMGVVFKAQQMSLNRVVALKMILAGQLASEEDVKRFYTEAEAAANLKHPNIVAIHEVGEHDGQHYFSMDYVEGQSLAEMIREQPLPPRVAAKYVGIIAEAVQYAHQHGTLHRDLKPSNILIDGNDQPHIMDFGLAKHFQSDSSLTATGQILGTPSYMAPEQALAKQDLVGPGSDVYSVGAILYALLTGRPPYQAESPIETLKQVIDTYPVPPKRLNPAIPTDLETVCLKCLEEEPRRRYSSAGDLAEETDRFLEGKPVFARPNGSVTRLWRWSRRNRATAALMALCLARIIHETTRRSSNALAENELWLSCPKRRAKSAATRA